MEKPCSVLQVMVDNLVKHGTIKFYGHYIDDTVLLVKCRGIEKVLKAFNGFDKNLTFVADKFENQASHFLDLEICPNVLTIFLKITCTGQYFNMDSLTYGNGKQPGSCNLLIKQRKYAQKKTCQRIPINKEWLGTVTLKILLIL